MSFWDPYDPYRQRKRQMEQRQAQEEAARRAREQEALRQLAEQEAARRAARDQATQRPPTVPPQIVERFEQELAQARRERDHWKDRYTEAVSTIEAERQALAQDRTRWEADAEARRTALEQELDAQRAQVRAEAEGTRERLLRNAEQRAFQETRKTLTRLLEVADNFDRLLAGAGADTGPLVEGARLTQRDFRRALEQVGVARLDSLGQPFDPAHHEAVTTVPSTEPEGTILQEIVPGYTFRGTLLRPAQVVITLGAERESGTGGEGEQGEQGTNGEVQ